MKVPAACARKFHVQRELSAGGFGAVLLATQAELDRPVALKVLRPEALEDAEQRDRFAGEARITAALDHPHIVRVLDHGVDEDIPWIAYEYLPGRTLTDAAKGRGMEWRAAATAAAQIAAALEAAHGAGILHRDVKPDNVLESAPGHWKITDFGIAKWTSGSEVKTKTGIVLGTPAYMAPELLTGTPASPSTDLYALGAMLFELLTGRLPVPGDSALQIMQARLKQDAPRLAGMAPRAPAALADLVDALLARDPALRPPGAARVRVLLEAALRGTSPPPLRRTANRIPHLQPAAPTRRWLLPAAACVLVALTALYFTRGTRPPPRPAPPTASALAAPDLTALHQLDSDIEQAIDDPIPGPSLLNLIDRLANWHGPRLARMPAQVAGYADWHQRKSARANALAERLEALGETRPDLPREALRALSARLEIHRYTYLLDIDQSAKLAKVAGDLLDSTLAFNPLGGEAEIAELLSHERSREAGLSHTLVAVRGAMEDLIARPASATRVHGVLFDSVRWFAGQFAFYRFRGRDIGFATGEAVARLIAPLGRLPGPRARLVSAVMSDAWHSGHGALKLNASVLPAVVERAEKLAAETPALSGGLDDLLDSYARMAISPKPAADPFLRFVRTRLRNRGGLAIAVMKGGEVKETRYYGTATRETVFELGAVGDPLVELARRIAADRGSTKLEMEREIFAKAGMAGAKWEEGRVRASLDDMIAWERALGRDPVFTRLLRDADRGDDVDRALGWNRAEEKGQRLLWRQGEDPRVSTIMTRYAKSAVTVILLCDAPRVDVERIQREVAALYITP